MPQFPHTSTDPSLPPQCSMGPSSDKALTFMKDHFLMDGKVLPIQGRPLLVKSDVTYTRITVDETRGVSGIIYRVMFLATGGFIWGCTQGHPSDPSLGSKASVTSPVPHSGGFPTQGSGAARGSPHRGEHPALCDARAGEEPAAGPREGRADVVAQVTQQPSNAGTGGWGEAQPCASPSPGHPLCGLLQRCPAGPAGQLQPAPELRRVRAGTGPLLRLAQL